MFGTVRAMSSPALRIHPFGSELVVQTQSEQVIAAIQRGLGRYPEGLAIGGSLHLNVSVHEAGAGDPGWPVVAADINAEQLTVRCGTSHAVVNFAAGIGEISLAASLLPIDDAVRLFVESAFTSMHVHHERLVAVHSALVSRNGIGLMLRGPSGAGKSTLTYSCLRRGMGITSDDWLYAAVQQPAGVFAGYPWRMLMTQDAAARFDEIRDIEPVPHTSEEGCKIAIYPPESQQVALQEVHAVVLLDPDTEFSLASVSQAEATERFWAASLPTEREHISSQWADGLLDRPTYVLRRGLSPLAAAEALDDLAASFR